MPRRVTYLLFTVLGLALGLRVWGIGFGLPYDFTPDEVHEILRAFKLGAGEYQWSFGKGGLYYILFVEYGLLYVVWWLTGKVADARAFAVHYVLDPTAFYLVGRLTVALMGTLTCLVIFYLGKRVYGWRVGLGAAFIGATATFHGIYSHLINVDIGVTLALWASLLAYLDYEKQRKLRGLIGAGVLGGMATAFKLPGAIVLPLLLAAIASRAESWSSPRPRWQEAGIVLFTALVTLTVVAPEWTLSVRTLHKNFAHLLEQGAASPGASADNLRTAIDSITILGHKDWAIYVKLLLKPYNIAVTCSALLGASISLWGKERWAILWTGLIVVFLGVMSLADRGAHERYILPIMPGLWLLSSRAIAAVAKHRQWVTATGFACVVALPLVALGQHDYMLTRPDTRVLAKEWIEAHVPSGAKILMDGMQYRFVQSPPLRPDKATATRHIAQTGAESERMAQRGSREAYLPGDAGWGGVSRRTLSLYAEAMEQVEGPTYELHSTVYGLKVEDLTYYVQNCFDYIITSSDNAKRYVSALNQQRFPKSVRFYEQLPTDPRLRVVYEVGPTPWQSTGPTITVYKVVPTCQASQNKAEHASEDRVPLSVYEP